MTQNPPEILFEVRNGLGLATLNRPQALNALTLNMVRLLDAQLLEWEHDPAVRAVAVQGAGGKAFCSGGDVKAVAQEVKAAGGLTALARDFFREEYVLNNRIHAYSKPYISLIDGICMGGGKGISAHGSHRIVSERVSFAMPETNIGFFPDVGGGWFLPRCPGETGTYLALTSKRIGLADCLYIGFATHAVSSADFPALLDALVDEKDIAGALSRFAPPLEGESALAPVREKIDACFGHNRVEDIIKALEADRSDFAQEALQALALMSPTSLKAALRQVRLGATLSFPEVMRMEYALSQHLVVEPDFFEGIRAALIDKDRAPKWKPATIEAVDDAKVERFFESLGARDLVLAA